MTLENEKSPVIDPENEAELMVGLVRIIEFEKVGVPARVPDRVAELIVGFVNVLLDKVAVPVAEMRVPEAVGNEIVLPEPLISDEITGKVNVLLVRVSVVARPMRVSVDVGSVSNPVLLIVEIIGADKVLLNRVSAPVVVARVTSPSPDGKNMLSFAVLLKYVLVNLTGAENVV